MRPVLTELEAAEATGTALAHDLNATWHQHEVHDQAEALASHVVQHVLDHHDPDAAIATTRLRGWQSSLLRHRWHLDADLNTYLHAVDRLRPRTAWETTQALQALLADSNADQVSAAVLCLVGIPAVHTWHVTLDDVSPDGTQLTWHGSPRQVPPRASRLLAAARASRRRSGATGTEPLHPWPLVPPFARHIRDAVPGTLKRHGLATPWEHALGAAQATDALSRLGLRLARLPAIPVELRTGPAPHPQRVNIDYERSGRVLRDPRHVRRLTDLEAAVLSHLSRTSSLEDLPGTAGLQRAIVNLRDMGLIAAADTGRNVGE